MISTWKSLTYQGTTKTFVLRVCSDGEYGTIARLKGADKYDQGLARAFSQGTEIWVRGNAGRDPRLVGHEIGHSFGFDHPNWIKGSRWAAVYDAIFVKHLGTMAFTGLLRWRDPEGLVPLAKQLLDGPA